MFAACAKGAGQRGHFNIQLRENKKWNKVHVPDEMGQADGIKVTGGGSETRQRDIQLLGLE